MREKLYIFGNTFGAGTQNVDAVTSVVLWGVSEVPPINTMGVPCAAVVRCLMDDDSGAGRC